MGTIAVQAGDAPELEAFLARRIYEHNAAATGYHDGESFTAVRKDGSGAVEAGSCGYTWGGCCYVLYLWVAQPARGKGLGSELLGAIERHAREKGCRLVLLSTHSFQAPAFYRKHGYSVRGEYPGYPRGHSQIFLSKQLG